MLVLNFELKVNNREIILISPSGELVTVGYDSDNKYERLFFSEIEKTQNSIASSVKKIKDAPKLVKKVEDAPMSKL